MAATASGWDAPRVFYHNTLGVPPAPGAEAAETQRVLQRKFLAFLEHFRIDAAFPYRESLRRTVASGKFCLAVELAHVQAFDEQLATALVKRPAELLPLFEEAARQLARHLVQQESAAAGGSAAAAGFDRALQEIRDPLADMQIQLNSSTLPMAIRDLESHMIGRLVRIPGIVVSASVVTARPMAVCVVCRGCRAERYIASTGAGGVSLPRVCPGPPGETDVRQQRCPLDPYVLVPERCRCVDQQTLKLQEAPESVPVGELPRQVLVTVDRALVNRIAPGTRVVVNGVYSIFSTVTASTRKETSGAGAASIRTPFVRLLGYEVLDGKAAASAAETGFPGAGAAASSAGMLGSRQTSLSEAEVVALSRTPGFYERFASSIAPSIFGHEDVKRSLACLLFGGSRKVLPDRIRLRGDINVLLLGDPGVAKSQFLKFVERVAPIAVYTSGKGSSAAGLTASVVRDPGSGEFYLEGGAMVLADGGVVCIDEFDKMDDEDRVAIHEAMEQQTISIAKAGITTILNSRTSVLAAANPIFGRYDEMKSPGENIDFSKTILSRFDMIFILRDEHDTVRDVTLARHVLAVHMQASDASAAAGELGQAATTASASSLASSMDLGTMRAYVAAAKGMCAPRLSAAAAEKLSAHYVSIRAQVHRMEQRATERSTIPITIRQLEAIVRIAESLAKMTLSPTATEAHVEEALRLFRVSTMQAVLSGHYTLEGMGRPELAAEVERVSLALMQRLPIGSSTSYRQVLRDLAESRRFSETSVVRAIDVMVQQERLLLRSQGKMLIRQR